MRIFKDVVHNCLVHPLLPFLPRRFAEWLHKTNGEWAYGDVK